MAAKVQGFKPQTARRILKHVGLVGSNQTHEWTHRGGSGGAVNVKWFKLLEDADGPTVQAVEVQYDLDSNAFTDLDPEPDPIDLINWRSQDDLPRLLENALEGYICQGVFINDAWGFHQGSCIAPPAEEP
jgi:hypothetical protein